MSITSYIYTSLLRFYQYIMLCIYVIDNIYNFICRFIPSEEIAVNELNLGPIIVDKHVTTITPCLLILLNYTAVLYDNDNALKVVLSDMDSAC